MENLGLFATIGALYLAAAALPGPNTVLIMHHAAVGRTRAAFWVVAGVCTGSVVWVTLSLLGFGVVLQRLGWIYVALKVAGGLYLAWLGLRLLINAGRPDGAGAGVPSLTVVSAQAYRVGLATAMTNPKSAAFWTSVFLVTVPRELTTALAVEIVALVAVLSAFWHGMLAVVFALPPVRLGYVRGRLWLDRAVGAILVGFGLMLAAGR